MAIPLTMCLLAMPFIVFRFVKAKFDRYDLDDESIKAKYGVLWEGYNTKNFAAVQYQTIFLVRRLAFAVVSVFIGPWDGGLVLIAVCYICFA